MKRLIVTAAFLALGVFSYAQDVQEHGHSPYSEDAKDAKGDKSRDTQDTQPGGAQPNDPNAQVANDSYGPNASYGSPAGTPGANYVGTPGGTPRGTSENTSAGSHSLQPGSDAGGIWRGTRDVKSSTFEELPPSDAPISLSNARMNFATVVENYVAGLSPKGYWSYKNPDDGTTLKLKLQAINKGSIEPLEGTLYRGQVLLRELSGGKLMPMDFTVDFSPSLWAVKKVALAGAEEEEDEPAILLARDDFAAAVRRHLLDSTRKTNGVFLVKDKSRKKTWRLKFVKIRAGALKKDPDGSVTGCVEFSEIKGRERLDLDFHAENKTGSWSIHKVTIHRSLKNAPPTLDAAPPTW